MAYSKANIFTFGEAVAVFAAEDELPVSRARDYQRWTGGAELNVAVGVSRLGLTARWFSRLGADGLGEAVLSDARSEGVITDSVIMDDSANTGLIIRNSASQSPIDVTYWRKNSAACNMSADDISEDLVLASDWVHITGITPAISQSAREATLKVKEIVKANSHPHSLDLNLRKKLWSGAEAAKVLRPLVDGVEVLIGGVEEYQTVFESTQFVDAAFAAGAKSLVVTNGSANVHIYSEKTHEELPSIEVKLVDPVGAGDALVAGLLAGLLSGLKLSEATRQGIICGAWAVTGIGDWGGLTFGKNGLVNSQLNAGEVVR
jgi:2-dehydro-3-deoxygluconokinase